MSMTEPEEPTRAAPDETPASSPEDGPRIDAEGLQATRKSRAGADVDRQRSTAPWEREDAPKGSTASSLMVYENGRPTRVQGPTHYHHLADGRVNVGYSGGTHHTEPGPDGQDTVTRILAIHEG